MLNRCARLVLLAAWLSGASAWAGAEGTMQAGLPERINMGVVDAKGAGVGANFTAPDGGGWTLRRPKGSVDLQKKSETGPSSWQIEAYFIQPDVPMHPIGDYVASVRKNILQGLENSKRFKLVALEVVPDATDTRCARIHLLLQDIAAQGEMASDSAKWSDQYVRSCGFKRYRPWGLELRYYHRYAGADDDPLFAQRAARLLDSLVLEEQ